MQHPAIRLSCLPAFVLALGLSAPLVTFAQPAADAPAPAGHFTRPARDLFAAATAVPADGANISILEDDDSYTFDEQGRMTHVGYTVYKVLTEKGAEAWDSISIGWEPWHEARPDIRVRVITPDGAEHQLDPKNINETPAQDGDYKIYSDGKRLHAPFPAISAGVVVEEEYTQRETEPLFAGGRAGWTTFGREEMPVQHSRLEFDFPSSLPLRTAKLLLPDVKPQRSESGGRVKLVYDIGRLEGVNDDDPNFPPDVARFPQVSYSTGQSWQELASEYSKIVDNRADAAAVKTVVAGLIAGKNTVAEKEAALLDYLDRNIRYTGIEFGGAAIVPHDPEETLGKKYGDCKDKATLLVTMLRAAGIPAYVALLNAGSRMDVPADLPGMGLFDHAIVYIPAIAASGPQAAAGPQAAMPAVWIDATDRYARLGQLPIADQGRLSLIARPETTALTEIPLAPATDNTLLEYRTVTLSENGPATVVEKTQPHGVYESRYRSYYADKPDKDTRDNLTNYVKSQYVSDKLTTVDRNDPADLDHQFQLTVACEKAKRGYTSMSEAEAAIRYEPLFFRLPDALTHKPDDAKKQGKDDAPARTADWELVEPYVVDLNYRIVPPAGFIPKELPKNTTIALGPASITEEFSTASDGAVAAHLVFNSAKRRYTVAEATELRNKIADLTAGPALLVSFEPRGEALLREGKVKEALASYRALVSLHPTEAIHHLQVANVLLQAGMGEAARQEARLAVKLEPDSAVAQKTLGLILEHDLVGRNLRPGSDLAGAAAAFRAAAKLDPDDNSIAGNLAILLEYDRVGRRYSPQAPLKDAIAEYEKMGQDKLNDLDLENNLAFAQFYAGDYSGACKSAQSLNPQPKALIAACIAAQQGAKAGMAEVNKFASNDDAFKDTAHTAGEMLMNVRQYPLAADFLQAGAAGDNAAQAVGLASLLRDARHHEDLKFANTPQDVVKHFFLMSMDPDLTLEKMQALASRSARAVMAREDPDELKKALDGPRQLNSQLAREGSFLDVTLDIMAQAFEPKVEGDDTTGYRLKVQIPGGSNMTFFVVKEDGEYRLLDSSQEPNAVAWEMLERIQAGDLRGAKILLDWLRDDSHQEGGDDPLGGPIFPRFWKTGAAPDANRMKLAAASILVGTKSTVDRGIEILDSGLKTAGTERERENIELALCAGYGLRQNFKALLPVASALLSQEPESRIVYLDNIEALLGLDRYDDAMKLADDRLKLLENDPDALRSKTEIETSRGNYDAARSWLHKLADMGREDAELLNETAWLSLYTGKVNDKDIATGIKATQLAKDNPHILHTLACLYAEAGKTNEARNLLIRSMDELNLDEPTDDYWYAFGLIAEQYGERDVAIADYRKLQKPTEALSLPTSSYELAQMRLKALNAAEQPAPLMQASTQASNKALNPKSR